MNAKYLGLYIQPILKSNVFQNSVWGLISKIFQTLFLTLFFIVISRHYGTIELGNYLIVTAIYQFVVGISTMGLGTWFIRELEHTAEDKNILSARFIKIQICLGFVFYLLNICLVYILYPQGEISILGLILGTNIVFDNIIYALVSLNIAEFKQIKTAYIMAIDAFVRLIIVSFLFITPFSIVKLSLLLVLSRLLTTSLFLRIGTNSSISMRYLWHFHIPFTEIKKQILSNWRFAVIVGLYLIYWRSATIITSKFLSLTDVINYEVAYKIFSLFNLLPIIVFSSVYPKFVKLHATKDYLGIRKLYHSLMLGFSIFSVISYAFIISFGDILMPFLFGQNLEASATCLKQMFITFLIFPTASLQANLLLALKLEKKDSQFNMISLAIFLAGCLTGLYFYKSITIINLSIFASFFVFHILQSVLLSKLKITSLKNTFLLYFVSAITVYTYRSALAFVNPIAVFSSFTVIVILATVTYMNAKNKKLVRIV